MGIFDGGRGFTVMSLPTPAPTFWSRHARKLLGGALLLLAVQDVFGAHGFLAMWRTQQEMKRLEGEVTRLDKENRALSSQVNSLKTDPKAIERIAREEMGLARPGEMIFKMPAPTGSSADSTGAGDSPKTR
jgi:cell division protein FtsB